MLNHVHTYLQFELGGVARLTFNWWITPSNTPVVFSSKNIYPTSRLWVFCSMKGFDRELIQQKCFSTNQTYINNYQYSLSSSHSTNDTNRFRKGEPNVSTSIDIICNCNFNQRVRTLDILEVVLSHRITTIDCLLSQKSMSTCNSQGLRTQLVWVYNHIYCNDSCQHDIL